MAPRKQRYTVKRILDRLIDDRDAIAFLFSIICQMSPEIVNVRNCANLMGRRWGVRQV
jgi:hypothetical protein